MGGEESEWVTGVHHKRLLIGHFREQLHGKAILDPILEDRAITPVGDEFIGVLSDGWV